MGVVLSTHTTFAPLSLASTIIGFVSFAFTLATFFRVFWANLATITHADRECRAMLSTLAVELAEERLSLRELRRHERVSGPFSVDLASGPTLDIAAIASLQSSLRRLTKQFQIVEEPFLATPEEVEARRAHRRRRLRRHSDGGEKSKSGEEYLEDDAIRMEDLYEAKTLGQKWKWLHSRAEVNKLIEYVSKLQTRRIATQVAEIACMLHSYKQTMDDVRKSAIATEDRMSRVVGMRRVD